MKFDTYEGKHIVWGKIKNMSEFFMGMENKK